MRALLLALLFAAWICGVGALTLCAREAWEDTGPGGKVFALLFTALCLILIAIPIIPWVAEGP